MVGEEKLVQINELTIDHNGKEINAGRGIVGATARMTSTSGRRKILDANANGTTIVSVSVPAYTTFILTAISLSANAQTLIVAGSGTLGSTTDYFNWLVPTTGIIVIADGETPIFKYINTTSAAVNLLIHAPNIINAATVNNPATTYVEYGISYMLIRNPQ